MTLTEKEQAAKQFVNRLRKECGLRALGKLKKGIPKHSAMCPIALSLEDCGVYYASPAQDRRHVLLYSQSDLPRPYFEPEVAGFMLAFDGDEYPHLEIPKATTYKIKKPGERKLTEVPL